MLWIDEDIECYFLPPKQVYEATMLLTYLLSAREKRAMFYRASKQWQRRFISTDRSGMDVSPLIHGYQFDRVSVSY